jgi:lincosamide nucleotidyltransferase A/C/D/E
MRDLNATRMMDLAAVLAVLNRLDGQAVTTWLDGGWGIDALIGEQTRPHGDLDLVVEQAALGQARVAVRTLGYRHDPAVTPGLPARVVLLDSNRRQVDLHPVVIDAEGNGRQPLGDGAWGSYPADGLTGVGLIGGRRVRCLTPHLQLRHHLGYPPRTNDRHDLRLLAKKFALSVPPDA